MKISKIHVTLDYLCVCGCVHPFYYPNVPESGYFYCAACDRNVEIQPIERLDVNIKVKQCQPQKLPGLKVNFVADEVKEIEKQEQKPVQKSNNSNKALYDECMAALEGLGSKKRKVNQEIVDTYLAQATSPSLGDFLLTGIPKRKEIKL